MQRYLAVSNTTPLPRISRANQTSMTDSESVDHCQSSLAQGRVSQCLISFGSNLGDRDVRIGKAARIVANHSRVTDFRASRLFQTPPIGGPGGQEPFLNAAAAFDTVMPAGEVLHLLQSIEDQLGRIRKERWGARSIDLDVVLHGDLIGGNRGLIVPHPRYPARRFVLQPACDVAAHYRDPRFGWTIKQTAEHIESGVASMALTGGSDQMRRDLCDRLKQDPSIDVFDAPPMAAPMQVIGNAPAKNDPAKVVSKMDDDDPLSQAAAKQSSDPSIGFGVQGSSASNVRPWVSAYIPNLPLATSEQTTAWNVPRVIARLQKTDPSTRWPAPHQIWPASWTWPEYRLELEDQDWAASEILSALQSMRCPLDPVTEDGSWWK